MKNKGVLISIAAVLIAIVLVVIFVFTSSKNEEKYNEYTQEDSQELLTYDLSEQEVESLTDYMTRNGIDALAVNYVDTVGEEFYAPRNVLEHPLYTGGDFYIAACVDGTYYIFKDNNTYTHIVGETSE